MALLACASVYDIQQQSATLAALMLQPVPMVLGSVPVWFAPRGGRNDGGSRVDEREKKRIIIIIIIIMI